MDAISKTRTTLKTQEELLRELFMEFDTDSDGRLSPSELRSVVRFLNNALSEREVNDLVNQAVQGDLSFEEFKKFILLFVVDDGELKEAETVFDLLDQNKDGGLSKDEFVRALKMIGEDLTEIEIDTAFRAADKNGDGVVDFNEFLAVAAAKK